MAEAVIPSPRSWVPPQTAEIQPLVLTKTFTGSRKEGSVFGGTVKGVLPNKMDKSQMRDFFADRFMRVQDEECLRTVTGIKFKKGSGAKDVRQAFDPSGSGESEITTVSAEELLELIQETDPDVDALGSGEVWRRRVELLGSCFDWKELQQVTLNQLTDAVELYYESHQEVLLGRPMLEGPTSMVMTGQERTPLTPQLLLANQKRKEVEDWRARKRSEASKKEKEIAELQTTIDEENKLIQELILSPKAWTRKGQAEIADMKRATKAKEGVKVEMEQALASIQKDAEMDVKSVLQDMWVTADEETKQSYIDEFRVLCDKYMEPRVGQRVRISALWKKKMKKKASLDISLAPGSCDAMNKTATRWFGNRTFEDGNFPDIAAGTLAHHGGMGTVKMVHRDRQRVMVAWDMTGKMEWYSTGYQCNFSLALCDQDEGIGTTGCLEGISSMRLMTNRADLSPSEAADRVENRRQFYLGNADDLPGHSVEGDKHIGRDYDRLTGTGYL